MRRRSWVTLVVLALIAVGCSNPETKRGVGVDKVNTDVGLGIVPVLGAAPPNVVVQRPIRRSIPTLPPIGTIPPFEVPTARPTNCPAAGDFDFPAIEAGVDPDPRVRPAEGSYPYKLDGKVVTDRGPETVDEFETRTVSKVEDDSVAPGAFHFTVTQVELLDERRGNGALETQFRVVPTSNTGSVPNPPAPAPPVSDTGRGVYLVSIVFKTTDDEGKPEEIRFEPSSPLQLLAFPVQNGSQINASGTDPQTGVQVTITGVLKGKKQIDACGDRVDTWFVDADQRIRFTDPETFQTETIEADYDYGVAPQYGGLLLYERVVAPKDGPIITVSSRVGKVPEQRRVSG